MKIETTPLDHQMLVATLTGRLDIAGAAEIETAFGEAAREARVVVVDLSGVSFLASIGIRLLLANAKALSRRDGHMILYGCDVQVEKVLRSTGVDQLIAIVATREDALKQAGPLVSGGGSM